MLDLDMELDADLGIDSIKRVEILSALQERLPDAPAVKPEHLGSLHTLADIASFLAGVNGEPGASRGRSSAASSSPCRWEPQRVRRCAWPPARRCGSATKTPTWPPPWRTCCGPEAIGPGS